MFTGTTNSQTAAFTPAQIFRIQNAFGFLEFGSSPAPVVTGYIDPFTGVFTTQTMYPAGPDPYYNFNTDRYGYNFNKNLISGTGLFSALTNSMSLNFLGYSYTGNAAPQPALIIAKTDGKVGIGHTNVNTLTAKLDVISAVNKLCLLTTSNYTIDNLSANTFKFNRDKTKALTILNSNYLGSEQNKESFVVMGNGATHIGEKSGNGAYKDALLSVYGQVVARSFHVTIDAGSWADFVFDKKYNLLLLADVEKYYLVNKHLPGVPSAIDLEDKGLDIADMESILLKKIEELTLYIVNQQKEMELIKQQLNELKK